jgi:hypothetical protein
MKAPAKGEVQNYGIGTIQPSRILDKLLYQLRTDVHL